MDSGLFESWGKGDKSWKMKPFKSILPKVEFDLYSSFDVYRTKGKSYEDHKRRTHRNLLESSIFLDDVVFFAILHESSPTRLVKLASEIVEEHSDLCRNVAVAERDIGKSLSERAETVVALRRVLHDKNCHLLHILGCGNPLSMLLYSYCGADTFDSVDWVRLAIDPSNYLTHDFAHLELLTCECKVCSEKPYSRGEYLDKLLLHNLLFYQDFVMQMQSLIRNDNIEGYVREHIGSKIIDQINEY